MPLREKNGAFVSSPACAFALHFGEQAAPAAQPTHQPCADPSGGSTLPPAANLCAVPTSPTPAEEGDVSSSVTNQDEAQSCKYDDQELSAAFSSLADDCPSVSLGQLLSGEKFLGKHGEIEPARVLSHEKLWSGGLPSDLRLPEVEGPFEII